MILLAVLSMYGFVATMDQSVILSTPHQRIISSDFSMAKRNLTVIIVGQNSLL